MSKDRPQYQQRDTVPTNAEIAERLRALSVPMLNLGADMDYVGGFGQMGERGRMMIEQAVIIRLWAHEIEEAQG